MRIVILSTVFAAAAVFALGCDLAPTSTPQAISGVLSQDTFPAPVTTVRVVSGTTVVDEAQVDVNSAFTLIVPPGKGYQIEFLSSSNGAGLVFPRSAGGVETKFDVAASQSPFDMGAVRYVGDPATRSFLFENLQDENGDAECGQEGEFEGENEDVCVDDDAENEACEDDEEDGDDEGDNDDVECEDGVDATTGLPCEDDDDGEVEDGDEEGDTDNVECEDGVDATTGLPCEDDDDGEVEDGEDEMPSDAAVAERNLPSSIGCGDEDDDDVECEQEGENEGDNEGC